MRRYVMVSHRKGVTEMSSTQYQTMAAMLSNETLREEAAKSGARGFYARAELAKRDSAVTFAD